MENKTNKIKYILYARKSSESEDRQIASIESQIKELQRIAKRENLEIIETLTESKSAKEPGRPIFNEMIEIINNNEAQGIICWKVDRLSRNPIDDGNIKWMLQKGIIQHIRTYEGNHYPGDSVLMLSVQFGMANQFILDLSANVKRGLRNKAENGWYPTFTSLGYIHDPLKKKGEKEIIKDPDSFHLVRKMFDLMLTGIHTPSKILEIANEEWGLRTKAGRKVARSTIYRIFTDPFYYGTYEYPKESENWYEGKHEPMITKDEYDKVQSLLGREGKPRPKRHRFAFSGMIRCGECGAMITAENKVKRQKNGNVHYYTYYHCTKKKNKNCSQKTIRRNELENQIEEVLEIIKIPSEFREWALDALKGQNEKEFEGKSKIIESQQKEYNSCVMKLKNLINMRANDEISEKEFKGSKKEITEEKQRYKKLLDDSDNNVDDWIKKAEETFTFAEIAKFRFENGGLEDKKKILFDLGYNFLLKDDKLSIEVEKPLLMIKKIQPELKRIHQRLEPLKNSLNKRTLGEMYSQSPKLLRG